MVRKRKQENTMIPIGRGIELYLSTLETEGKSPGYIEWLEHRSRLLERQWQRILDAYQDGLLEKDELAQRKQALDQELAQLQSLLTHAQEISQQDQSRLHTVQDFTDFSQRMLGTLENPSEEVKREEIRLLVDHIVPITENGRLSLKHTTLRSKGETRAIGDRNWFF